MASVANACLPRRQQSIYLAFDITPGILQGPDLINYWIFLQKEGQNFPDLSPDFSCRPLRVADDPSHAAMSKAGTHTPPVQEALGLDAVVAIRKEFSARQHTEGSFQSCWHKDCLQNIGSGLCFRNRHVDGLPYAGHTNKVCCHEKVDNFRHNPLVLLDLVIRAYHLSF